MTIILSPLELDNLLLLGVVKLLEPNVYGIDTKPDLRGKCHTLRVSISNDDNSKVSKDFTKKELDDYTDRYINAFPTIKEMNIMLKPYGLTAFRNLRVGNKTKIGQGLLKLLKKYSIEQIVSAIKHEVKNRLQSSILKKTNDFQYMQSSLSWLNNDCNIETLIEEMNDSSSNSHQINTVFSHNEIKLA